MTSTGVTYENSTITRCVTRVPISCNYKPERLSLEIKLIFLELLSSWLKMNNGLSGLTWVPKYIRYWRILLLIRNSSKCEWFQRCPPNIKVVLKCTSTTVLFWWNQLVKNNQVRYRCPYQLQNQMPRSNGITFLKSSTDFCQVYHKDQIISNIKVSCCRYLGTVESHFLSQIVNLFQK